MNIRTTVILFGVLCVFLFGFFLLQQFGFRTPDERKEFEKWLMPSLNDPVKRVEAKDLTRLVVERNRHDEAKRERLEFTRQGNDWRMVSPKDVRTDSGAVNRLLDQVMRTEKMQYAERTSSDLAAYGLDNPATVVTMYKGEIAYTLSIGNSDPKNPILIVTTSDDPKKPRPINSSRLDKVFGEVTEFRSKELFTFTNSSDVVGARVAGVNRKPPIELEKTDNKNWRFKEPKLGDADDKEVGDLLTSVTGIRVEKNQDFVAEGNVDWAKYGLTDDKAAFAITLHRKPSDAKEPVRETLLIGNKDTTTAQAVNALSTIGLPSRAAIAPTLPDAALSLITHHSSLITKDLGSYFAKPGNENYVVRIDAKHLKAFEKKPDELRSKDFVQIDATKADAINVVAGGETLRLRRPDLKTDSGASAPANWDLYTGVREKVKTHLNVVPKLIDAMNNLELKDAKAFLDDDAKKREWFGTEPIDLGLDKPQAEVLVWLDGIKRDKDGKPEGDGEPKLKDDVKDKPTVRVVIGRKDDKRGVVYVRRQAGDEPAVVLAVPDPWFPPAPEQPVNPNFPRQPPPQRGEPVRISNQVTAGYYAFRDHMLPSFKANEVTKVFYNRGGTTYAAEKEEKKDDTGAPTTSWNLKQPVEAKGGFQVDMLLFALAGLNAETLVTDKATPQDLKDKYGLVDKPLVRTTVTAQEKDKRPAEFTYVIGKATDPKGPQPNRFYARLEVRPAEGNPPDANQFVFLVPWSTAQALDLELRNTDIFPLEATAKPEEVTFTWRQLDKDKKLKETKLELVHKTEKDAKARTVKSLTVNSKDAKADLPKLDTNKLEQLLGTAATPRFGGTSLTPLQATRFVIHNGKPEPKHRLDPASKDNPPALVVEIKYDDKKTTRSLTIGDRWEPKQEEQPGLGGQAFYYAKASTLPNAVFLLSEAGFKDLVAGSAYFKAP